MNTTTPHYLVFLRSGQEGVHGRWGFALCRSDGAERIEASDVEPKASPSRLDLLALVRALESLDQPSRVTFIGLRPDIERGIRYGLPEWRSNGWQWEWFGKMVPVRNCDLWQRVDRAMQFHQVDCRRWRIDAPDRPDDPGDTVLRAAAQRSPHTKSAETNQPAKTAVETAWGLRVIVRNWLIYVGSMVRRWRRRLALGFPARRYAGAY